VPSQFPALDRSAFADRLAAAYAGPPLDEAAVDRLFLHFEELRRWAPRVDLVGPGAAVEIVERHYAEALEGLRYLPAGPLRLADLGSGAGFPGLILALARGDLETWLVEPRERRAAFLATVARRAGLAVEVVGARVSAKLPAALPKNLQIVTLRALRLEPRAYEALRPNLAPTARLLVWAGDATDAPPPSFRETRRRAMPDSLHRQLREYALATGETP